MNIGLAIWHYPHRTLLENISFFKDNGFDTVSLLGYDFVNAIQNAQAGEALASVIVQSEITVSVHFKLPESHSEKDVEPFKKDILRIAAWQKKHRLISVLSFDVPQKIRDHITDYVDFVVQNVKDTKIALEDFGLNEKELKQIEHLRQNRNFGMLMDTGHMFLRIRGENKSGLTLFTNSADECVKTENPGYEEFLRAFRHKKFPIFEIHIHNNDGVEDWHYFLEDGACSMGALAEAIKASGFDGILTIESAPGFKFECKGKDADERILKTFHYLNRLL